jgi:phosphomannomutase
MSIFRSYDIRGIYDKDLTYDVVNRIGKALGTLLKGKQIVCIGHDTRLSSLDIYEALASGLMSTGCNIIFIGMVPNPVAYFYAWKNKMFGCYITASHNPKEWNGLKLIRPDGSSFVEEIHELKAIFDSGKFLKGEGRVVADRSAIEEYKKFLKRKLGGVRGKIAVECFGGAGVKAVEVFRYLGLEVVPLHEKPDGNFYNFSRPEPKGKNLDLLKKTVRKVKADFGLGFDGDADRSVFVDDRGREVNAGVINSIFIKAVLRQKKGKVVATVDSASEIEDIVKKCGGEIVWSPIGHNRIEQAIIKEKAVYAGEQSSHVYLSRFYPFSDGILATLYLLKILKGARKKLSRLVDGIKLLPVERFYVEARNDEVKNRVVENLKKQFPDAIDLVNGFKIKLNDVEWVLVRASQTLPEIVITVEARNKRRLEELARRYSGLLKRELERA